MTGHPEALSYPYDSCMWAGRITREGGHGQGWWRYEQTAYYTDGLLRLGYALGDKALVAKGEAGVDWTLAKTELSVQSKAVYRAYVIEGRPIGEVAAKFGISRNSVSQIKTRVERMIAAVEAEF